MGSPSVRSYCSGRKLAGMKTFLEFMHIVPRQAAHLFVVPVDPGDGTVDTDFECNVRRPAEFAAGLRGIHQVSHVFAGSIRRDLGRLLDTGAELATDRFHHFADRMVPAWRKVV